MNVTFSLSGKYSLSLSFLGGRRVSCCTCCRPPCVVIVGWCGGCCVGWKPPPPHLSVPAHSTVARLAQPLRGGVNAYLVFSIGCLTVPNQKWRDKKNPSASWWDSNPIDHRSQGTAGRELKACPWQFISDKGRTIALRQSILTTEQTSAPFPSGVVSKHFYSKEQAALIGGLPLPHWLPLPR